MILPFGGTFCHIKKWKPAVNQYERVCLFDIFIFIPILLQAVGCPKIRTFLKSSAARSSIGCIQRGWNQKRDYDFMWLFWGDITAIQFSISKPFLSIEFVFWFWENQKGKLEILGEACCSTTFEAAAFAQYWGETAIPSCCCFWNSQKWKTIKGFFLQFVFKTKPIYPTVKYFYTYWVLFLISTFLFKTNSIAIWSYKQV